jgi:hypothetical protein
LLPECIKIRNKSAGFAVFMHFFFSNLHDGCVELQPHFRSANPLSFMSASDFLIKNCPGTHAASGCPAAWSRLKTSFSDAVRHCSACNRKVYLCQNEQDIKFYSSLKYPIAVDGPEAAAALANLRPVQPEPPVVQPPASPQPQSITAAPAAPVAPAAPAAPAGAPSVWRRAAPLKEKLADNAADFPDMPAFMRLLLQPR